MADKVKRHNQPKGRSGHSCIHVDEDIIVWGGVQEGLPETHTSDLKLQLTSLVEVFRNREGRWQQEATTGTPPLGVISCASCAVGRKIYYFGGWCNHDRCRHNSLHKLNVDDWKWTQCFATSDNGPMKKSSCGMVAFHQSLLVVGGYGKLPKNLQQLAEYNGKGCFRGEVITNEHHMHTLETDQWIRPTVSGDIPPPVCGFTIEKISDEKALLYGGKTPNGKSSEVRVASVVRDSVHWERLISCGPEKPRGRYDHAMAVLSSPAVMGNQLPMMLVAGGRSGVFDATNDAWLLSIGDGTSWIEVKNMPRSVAERCQHSIITIAISHACVWLMVIGKEPSHPDVVLLELNLSSNRHWEPGIILENDEIYQGYSERFCLKFPSHNQIDLLATAAVAGRRKEAQLEQQLKHAHIQVEQARSDVFMKDKQLQLAQQQLQEKEQQLLQQNQQLQEKDKQLQEKDQQLQDNAHQLHKNARQLQEREQSLQRFQQQVKQLQSDLLEQYTEPWVVVREELTLTQEVLGTGAFGEVRIAVFRGLRVAAKCLHKVIISDYYLRLFSREMNIAAQVRHPNLLLFLGASTTQGKPPIILTELMPTSLHAELERNPLSRQQIKSIATDVSCGLNYLHKKKPDPIVHRDISSPNILMEPVGAGSWRAKVSDYGSANFVRQVTNISVNPGNPAYSAPEANSPNKHSTKMDVYSFGVLLTEMCLHEPPKLTTEGRARQFRMVQWDALAEIIENCTVFSPDKRPTLADVLENLREI